MPIEPPIRWSMFSCGVASGSSLRLSEANAAVIAGMNAKPTPMPRTSIATESHVTEVCAAISPNGIVASVVTMIPMSAIGPPPYWSVSRPTSGSTSAIPRPIGAVRSPVATTLSPRICCQ